MKAEAERKMPCAAFTEPSALTACEIAASSALKSLAIARDKAPFKREEGAGIPMVREVRLGEGERRRVGFDRDGMERLVPGIADEVVTKRCAEDGRVASIDRRVLTASVTAQPKRAEAAGA